MGTGDDIGVALALQLAHDGGAYHAAVSGYVYFGVFFHILGFIFLSDMSDFSDTSDLFFILVMAILSDSSDCHHYSCFYILVLRESFAREYHLVLQTVVVAYQSSVLACKLLD